MGGLSSSLGSKIVDVVIIINSYFCRFNGPIVMNVPYSFICVADSLEFIANSVENWLTIIVLSSRTANANF